MPSETKKLKNKSRQDHCSVSFPTELDTRFPGKSNKLKFYFIICSLSPAEEWKRREVEFSQKWSRDRGLGRIAQFVQCSKNFLRPSHPFIPIVIMLFYSICKLYFQPLHKFFSWNLICDKSINLNYIVFTVIYLYWVGVKLSIKL